MSKYVATFDPQAWMNDYALSVDPEGDTDWDCTEAVREFVGADGGLMKPFRLMNYGDDYLDNDDILKSDPAAPEWVREWSGPFTITVRVID